MIQRRTMTCIRWGAVVSLAALAAGAVQSSARPAHHGGGPAHWSYHGSDGPDHWGALAQTYRLCAAGRMQSPIDLAAPDVHAHFAVSAAYRPGPLAILNNGHTVQVDFPAGSEMISGGARYRLLQVHFHTPSEETIEGAHAPMVAHFVHADASGVLAVLGVLFEVGAPNQELAKVIAAAPRHARPVHAVAGVAFDPRGLLPSDLTVWRYEGSLTTPPCSEGVRWHVALHRVTASAAQIAALHGIVGDNARPVQPRFGRVLVSGTD